MDSSRCESHVIGNWESLLAPAQYLLNFPWLFIHSLSALHFDLLKPHRGPRPPLGPHNRTTSNLLNHHNGQRILYDHFLCFWTERMSVTTLRGRGIGKWPQRVWPACAHSGGHVEITQDLLLVIHPPRTQVVQTKKCPPSLDEHSAESGQPNPAIKCGLAIDTGIDSEAPALGYPLMSSALLLKTTSQRPSVH